MRTAGSPRRDTGISGEDTGRKLYEMIEKYLWKIYEISMEVYKIQEYRNMQRK
jgi:hypothetical protein